MRKIKFETVENAYRNLNKIRNAIHDHYGFTTEHVLISDIVLKSCSECRTNPRMLMHVRVTWPQNLARHYETAIRRHHYGQDIDVEPIDLKTWCRIDIGLDEYGKLFTYVDDTAKFRNYGAIRGPLDIGKEFAEKSLGKQV